MLAIKMMASFPTYAYQSGAGSSKHWVPHSHYSKAYFKPNIDNINKWTDKVLIRKVSIFYNKRRFFTFFIIKSKCICNKKMKFVNFEELTPALQNFNLIKVKFSQHFHNF